MLALLLLLGAHHALGRDHPKQSNFIIKQIESCPEIGYYFRREPAQNSLLPGPCYLCFCRDNGTAVCWSRENRRCDLESYRHHGRRESRVRRSPAGFSDIFFRDAARDFFDKQTPQQCKPYESSFSEGCPPDDWCTGCTVCDCDANGRWDCHILSFCPDGKGKKQMKKHRGPIKKKVVKKYTPPTPKPKPTRTTKKTTPKPAKKIIRSDNKLRPNRQAVKPTARPVRTKKPIIKKRKVTSKPIVIKKNMSTKRPVNVNANKRRNNVDLGNNSTEILAQRVVQKVLATVQKIISKRTKQKSSTPQAKEGKIVQKRSMPKNNKIVKAAKKPKVPVNKKKMVKRPTTKNPTTKWRNVKRNKREAMDIIPSTPSLIPEGNTVAPTLQVTSPSSANRTDSIDYYSYSVNVSPKNYTTSDLKYYKYSVDSEYTKHSTITPMPVTESVYVLNSTEKLNNVVTDYNTTSMFNTATTQSIFLNNFSNITIANNSTIPENTSLRNNNTVSNDNLINNVTAAKADNVTKTVQTKTKINRKDMGRKVKIPKKYNLAKMITTLNNKIKKDEKISMYNNYEAKVARNKVNSLQNALKKLASGLKRNNTTKKAKARRFNLIKYLKKFFKNIFNTPKNRNISIDKKLNKNNILKSLCESFGPCTVHRKNKLILQSKLEELNTEAFKILRTIKIIKGLLQLVDFPKIGKVNDTRSSKFRDDVHKLNSIIKGSYTNEEGTYNLSDTQFTQISYIKSNTQLFIKSVGKFASILNDIIAILTSKNVNDKYVDRNIRYARKDGNTDKNETIEAPFKKLREILVKYNLIQNTFMRRMYKMLDDFENKLIENDKVKTFQVSDISAVNDTRAVETYTKNIINNLRKLKSMALTLNSRRKKRESMKDDDAVEYLLTLMEYLLKQNYPLDAAPVNDGIDLLIEAIKNAPDIKPIKKKVLEYTPINLTVTRTARPKATRTSRPQLNSFAEEKEILSDFNKISDDDNATKVDEKSMAEDKSIDVVNEDNAEVINENVYYRRNEKETIDGDNKVTTEVLPDLYVTTDDKDIEERGRIDKDSDGGDDRREVFSADMDDDVMISETTTVDSTDAAITTTTENPNKATPYKSEKALKSYNNDDLVKDVYEKKSRLDWIEATYDQEEKEAVNTTRRNKITKIKENNNISAISREVDEESKDKQARINPEEVMYKKQMDLLNSLDYGTEKSDIIEDSDSKDGVPDDRYSDAFPAYFV